MGRALVKIKDLYFEWSSVVDAPIMMFTDKESIEEYQRFQYGESGMRDFERRWKRLEEKGTSYIDRGSAEEVIRMNRAGPNETELTTEQIYDAIGHERPISLNGESWQHKYDSGWHKLATAALESEE